MFSDQTSTNSSLWTCYYCGFRSDELAQQLNFQMRHSAEDKVGQTQKPTTIITFLFVQVSLVLSQAIPSCLIKKTHSSFSSLSLTFSLSLSLSLSLSPLSLMLLSFLFYFFLILKSPLSILLVTYSDSLHHSWSLLLTFHRCSLFIISRDMSVTLWINGFW